MKIFCIGRNYTDHIHELKNEVPESMVIFMKPETSLHDISLPWSIPDFSNDIHFECEIVLKVSKKGTKIQLEQAEDYFDEISLGIDFTARDLQSRLKEKGLPWEKAKAFDGSALVGDFVSKKNYDLNNVNFKLLKNNMVVQNGYTSQMIHSFSSIVCELSKYFTLQHGDLIFTGTPAGVGAVKSEDLFIGELEGKEILNLKII
jgi:2-keto-4-pentenoate hydratase/2-oxohepta-3-ene-1,7-dioic acid hydratase in catechol pathway